MYEEGETLWLTSKTVFNTDVTDLNPASIHAFLRSSRLRSGVGRQGPEDIKRGPLVYKMLIRRVYKPFTMAVVCRVQLIAVYESPIAVARFVPLPKEPDSDDYCPMEPSQHTHALDKATPDGPEYILKLYDRRCFINVRAEFDNGAPFSQMKARAYQKYLQDPVPLFPQFVFDMPEWNAEDVECEKNQGLFEASLEKDARETWEKEVAVYDALSDLQGKSIPKMYDTVSCYTKYKFSNNREPIASDEAAVLDSGERFVDGNLVQGILIEFVPGVSLRTFLHSALRATPGLRCDIVPQVASIADEAIGIVLQIDRYPVLNRDVRLDNMLVRHSFLSTLRLNEQPAIHHESSRTEGTRVPQAHQLTQSDNDRDKSTDPGVTRCVAIDFGHTRLRFPDETDEQWRCAKRLESEEARLASEIRVEINKIAKEVRAEWAAHPGPQPPAGAWEGQGPLWNWERRNVWHRVLSSEEQQEYEKDVFWGHHPDHWK